MKPNQEWTKGCWLLEADARTKSAEMSKMFMVPEKFNVVCIIISSDQLMFVHNIFHYRSHVSDENVNEVHVCLSPISL